MGIKVVKKGNKIIAKGIPKISKGAILTGILILILCLLSSSSPKPFNVLVIAIIGIIIIIGSLIHAIRERQKAIRESGYTPLGETTPNSIGGHNFVRKFNNSIDSGIKCSNCGNITATMNSFCPHCGSRMKQ